MTRSGFRIAVAAVSVGIAAFVWWRGAIANPAGLTWDEAYYYPTYKDVAAWFGVLFGDPALALSDSGLRAGWERINELPPLTKLLGALAILPERSGQSTLAWMRLFPAVALVGTLALLALLARRWMPAPAALLVPAFYVSHPHVYGHAQLAATETLFAFLTVFTIWCALHDLRRARWRWALAAALALALATKVNALILIVAVVLWLMTKETFRLGRVAAPRRHELLAMLTIVVAPVGAFALWPWLWAAPVEHLRGYLRFIAEHSHQGTWFFGERRNFGGPPAPMWYPLAMLVVCTPVCWLLAVAAGLLRATATLRRRGGSALRLRIPAPELLLLLCVFGPLAASSLPNAPKYDGVRLFFPAFAPLALLAARALLSLSLAARARRRGSIAPRASAFAFGLVTLALIVAETQMLARAPRPLSFFNAPTVFLSSGRTDFPFDATYWGDALTPAVVAELNRALPPNAKVRALAFQGDALAILQEWGALRRDIDFGADPPYDAHLLQNRKGFWGNAEWSIATRRPPLEHWHKLPRRDEWLVLLCDGAPPGR